MVGAGLEVLADPLRYAVRVAPRNERIDQAIAAAVGQLLLGKAEAEQRVAVVG